MITIARVDHQRRFGPYAPEVPRTLFRRRQPGVTIIERAAWAGDLEPVGPLVAEDDVRFLIVHHTVSSNTYAEGDVGAILRSMYNFHTNDKGWSDVAYNFCVDRFGRVWETRAGSAAGPVRGDATGGSQGFALLCAFIGDHRTEPPSEAATTAMAGLLAALGGRYGIDLADGATTTFVSRGSNRHAAGVSVTAPTICPHRLMSQTECPGDVGVEHINTRLIPLANGVPPVDSTTTTSTTTTSTTPTSTTTTTPTSTTTTAPTTAPTEATITTTSSTAIPSTTTEATASTSPTSTAPSAGASEALGEAGAADASESGGLGSEAVLYGSAGLVVAGVAALVGLRRRTT